MPSWGRKEGKDCLFNAGILSGKREKVQKQNCCVIIKFVYLFVELINLLFSANMVVILNDNKTHVSFKGSVCFASMISLLSIRSGRWEVAS